MPVATRRGPARQGRPTPARPVRGRRQRPRSPRSPRLLSALFVARRRARFVAGAGRPVAAASPSGSAGPRAATWPSTCSWSASATTTKRGGEIDRALTCLGAESLAPDAEGDIWWTRRPRGVGQAHRRRVARTCARASGCRSRSSPTRWCAAARPRASTRCRRARRSRWPSSRCGSSTGSCSCSTPRRRPSSGAARRRTGVRPGLRPRPAARLTLVELHDRSAHRRAPTSTSPWRAVPAGRPGPRRRRAPSEDADGVADGLDVQRAARRPVPAGGDRATSTRSASGNAALQQVLRHLLLSKEARGTRPRLHLLRRARHQPARRGLRGPDVLHRLLRRGGPLRGRQGRRRREGLVGGPGRRAPTASPTTDFVTTDGPESPARRRPVLHQQGTFVFRLAGRERQQSASYYTPEVLTRFVVSPGARGAARPGRAHHDRRRRSSS